MIGLKHGQEFQLVFLCGGQFLFQGVRQQNIQDVNHLVDDEGRVYGAEFRIWKALNLRTLDPALWPPTFPIRAAGHAEAQQGLHDGHISWTLDSFLKMPPGHTKPLIVHPRLALKLLDGHLPSVQTLGAKFVSSDDRIICIFHSDGHWALLWGRLHVDTMCWKYCDGIPGFGNSTALRLASTIYNELTLDWIFDPWHQ
jgi:hypothetical protein